MVVKQKTPPGTAAGAIKKQEQAPALQSYFTVGFVVLGKFPRYSSLRVTLDTGQYRS
jgi:hypothetical protein